MTGTARRTGVARGQLARHLIALALLAGLGFVVGLQCTGGMAAEMRMPHSGTMVACDPPSIMSSAAEHGTTTRCAMPPASEHGSSGLVDLGGMLATCLVLLVAVVTAAVTLRRGHSAAVDRPLRPVLVLLIRAVRPRAPSLAQLCLLRT